MRKELLAYIINGSSSNVRDGYPHGYTNIPAVQTSGATELHNEGLIVAYPNNANPDGSIPVVPTDKGIQALKDVMAAAAQPPAVTQPAPPAFGAQPAPVPGNPANIKISSDVPMPAAVQRGFQGREGGNAVDRYGFVNMQIGQSFHVAPSGDPDKPIHRTFSSIVSQANAKLWPKHYAIREAVAGTDPEGAGARVWRVDDMQGEKPEARTRKRRASEAAPAPQPAAGGFPAPSGFPAPGAFPGQTVQPSAAAPAPFPENFGGAPGGFGGGGFGFPPS